MGIVNVTPDSFSDGGRFFEPQAAIDHALQLAAEGADLIDIGGESTRPGSQPVSEAEELRRVMPVVEGVCRQVTCAGIDRYFKVGGGPSGNRSRGRNYQRCNGANRGSANARCGT